MGENLHFVDPADERSGGLTGPAWSVVPAEYGCVTYLGRYRFGLSQRYAEMYFAPQSPTGIAGLLLLFERTPDKIHFAALNGVGELPGGPALKQAFDAARDCARQHGFAS